MNNQKPKKPNLFIVGQPKSGTSALHTFLAEHPEVYMSQVKEPHFFCQDFHQESDRFYGSQLYYPYRDEQSYLKLFASASSEKILGESSVLHLYSKVAAQNIYQFNPDAKIIIMLREPISFLSSLHNQYLHAAFETESDFSKALTLELARKQGENIKGKMMNPSLLFYSEIVKYGEQIKRFYDLFEPSQIMTIIFEDFKQNNDLVYQKILNFLEIDPNFKPVYRSVYSRKKVRFAGLNNLVRNPQLVKFFRDLLSPEFTEFVRTKIVEKFLLAEDNSRTTKPKVPDYIEQNIQVEISQLSELLQRDLRQIWL